MTCPGRCAFLDDPTQCTHVEYGNSLSFMGGGAHHPSAYHKYAQGWIGKCNVVTASSGTFTLVPQELPCDGVQLLASAGAEDAHGAGSRHRRTGTAGPGADAQQLLPRDARQVRLRQQPHPADGAGLDRRRLPHAERGRALSLSCSTSRPRRAGQSQQRWSHDRWSDVHRSGGRADVHVDGDRQHQRDGQRHRRRRDGGPDLRRHDAVHAPGPGASSCSAAGDDQRRRRRHRTDRRAPRNRRCDRERAAAPARAAPARARAVAQDRHGPARARAAAARAERRTGSGGASGARRRQGWRRHRRQRRLLLRQRGHDRQRLRAGSISRRWR